MGTMVEFWLLVLDSLKYNSKAESAIKRFAEADVSRSLNINCLNHLFSFFIYLIFYFYFLFHFSYINRKLTCMAIATDVIDCHELIKNMHL